MRPNITILVAATGAVVAGFFAVFVALINERSSQRQTRLQHQLDEEDQERQVRRELYRDLSTWAVILTADLLAARDLDARPQLVSLLVRASPRYRELLPRVIANASPQVDRYFAAIGYEIADLLALAREEGLSEAPLNEREAEALTEAADRIGELAGAIAGDLEHERRQVQRASRARAGRGGRAPHIPPA